MVDEQHNKPDENKKPITARLNSETRRSYTIPKFTTFGSNYTPVRIDFLSVPLHHEEDAAPWYVLFKFGEPAPQQTIGLAIYGDVIIGRDPENSKIPADLDTSELKAQELGVSRNHALLRPTKRNLFLLDMGSTNGTYVNAIPIGQGMAQTLKTGDTVALAGLTFEVEIKAMPGEPEPSVSAADLEPPKTNTTLSSILASMSSEISESMFERKGSTGPLILDDEDKPKKRDRLKRLMDDDEDDIEA